MAGETAVLRYLVRHDPVLSFQRLYRGVSGALSAWLALVPKGPRLPAGPEGKPLPAPWPVLRGIMRSRGNLLLFAVGAIFTPG